MKFYRPPASITQCISGTGEKPDDIISRGCSDDDQSQGYVKLDKFWGSNGRQNPSTLLI